MKNHSHATKKLNLETEQGDIDLCLDENGLSVKVSNAGVDGTVNAASIHQLPLSAVTDLLEFLDYLIRSARAPE